MAFFANDAINRVNTHAGIRAFAQSAGGIFVPVFLLRAGLPIQLVLLAQAAIVAGRFAIRPLLLPCARRLGAKAMLTFGTAAMAAPYIVLPFVHGLGIALIALCALTAVAEVIYWTFMNTVFSTLGDAEFRGHQASAGAALVAVSGIAGPLLGALALVRLGARPAFALVACVQLLSVVPLLGLPDIPIKWRAEGVMKAARPGILFSALDGWFDTFFITVWQIALFIALRKNFESYGGAMALAALVGAGGGMFLGRHIDAGHGRSAVLVAYGVLISVAALRCVSLASPALALVGNAAGAIGMILISPVVGVISNLAKASPCPFRFHMGTEAGWDVGCFGACLAAAALLSASVPLAVVILLAIPAGGADAALLWKLDFRARTGAAAIADSLQTNLTAGGPMP